MVDSPLAALAEWPVETAAAAVVTSRGVVDTFGPLDHSFFLASVTKPLVAYSVLVAVEEGSLKLEAPAGPEGSTIAHLLAHASGLGLSGKTQHPVGRRRIYSNAGFDLLGDCLAAATGFDPSDYLREAVFDPLGMTRSALRGSPASHARSTIADLIAWLGELLSPQLISEATLAAATKVWFPGLDGIVPGFGRQRPNDWGLGFEIRGLKTPHWTAPESDPRTFGHFGRSGTFFWVDRSRDLAMVACADRQFDLWAKDLWPLLNAAVLGHAWNQPLSPELPMP